MEREYIKKTIYDGERVSPGGIGQRGVDDRGFDQTLLPDTEMEFVSLNRVDDSVLKETVHLPTYNVVLSDTKREHTKPPTEWIELQGYAEDVKAVTDVLRPQIEARSESRVLS